MMPFATHNPARLERVSAVCVTARKFAPGVMTAVMCMMANEIQMDAFMGSNPAGY